MPARAAWRPAWWAWAALAAAAILLARILTPGRFTGAGQIIVPLLILAGVLALRRLWELPPAGTMCAAITLSVFSGAWHHMGLGGLPFDRLLIVFVLAQLVLHAPGAAGLPRPTVGRSHLLMGVTVLYVLLSAIAAGTAGTETGALGLLDQLGAIPFLLFLVTPAVFAGEGERDLLLATLVGLGIYLGLTAIFEALGPHALVFPRYILAVDQEISGEARAGGPFQAVIAEGFSTFACAVAAVMAFVRWRGRRLRWLAVSAALISGIGCLLTLERGVWIAAGAATLIAMLATRRTRAWLLPGIAASTVIVAAALALTPGLAQRVSARTGDRSTVWDRQNQISAGLRMVAAKPLFGFGWDSYGRDNLDYFRQSADYPMEGYELGGYGSPGKVLPLHETYLAYTVELGIVGALLWIAAVLCGLGSAILNRGPAGLLPWKLGLLACGVCFLVIGLFNPYQPAFPVLLLWVWAGVARGQPAAPKPITMELKGAAWGAG
jgi:putative inorganic carbon (hco3(-)) transporter